MEVASIIQLTNLNFSSRACVALYCIIQQNNVATIVRVQNPET